MEQSHVDLYLVAQPGGWAGMLRAKGQEKFLARAASDDEARRGLMSMLELLNRPCRVRVFSNTPAAILTGEVKEHLVERQNVDVSSPDLGQVEALVAILFKLRKSGLPPVACAIPVTHGHQWTTFLLTDDELHVLMGRDPTTEKTNRLSLKACVEALKAVTPPNALCLCTDSEYLLSGEISIQKWALANWHTKHGQPLQNVDLWQAFWDESSEAAAGLAQVAVGSIPALPKVSQAGGDSGD